MVFNELDSHGAKPGTMILEDETYAIPKSEQSTYLPVI